MIPQAYKYISSSLWPRLAFFELKTGNILKSSTLEKSELPWEQNFVAADVLPVELIACQVSMVYAANWPR